MDHSGGTKHVLISRNQTIVRCRGTEYCTKPSKILNNLFYILCIYCIYVYF